MSDADARLDLLRSGSARSLNSYRKISDGPGWPVPRLSASGSVPIVGAWTVRRARRRRGSGPRCAADPAAVGLRGWRVPAPLPGWLGAGAGSGLAGRPADLRGSARRWVLAGRVPASMRRNRKAINNCQGGDALAPPPVGDNLRRRRFGYGQRSLEERPCRHAVPLGRDVHVDDLPVLVDGAVDIAPPAADLDVRFVDPPAIAYRPPEGLAASAHSGVKRCTQR